MAIFQPEQLTITIVTDKYHYNSASNSLETGASLKLFLAVCKACPPLSAYSNTH